MLLDLVYFGLLFYYSTLDILELSWMIGVYLKRMAVLHETRGLCKPATKEGGCG